MSGALRAATLVLALLSAVPARATFVRSLMDRADTERLMDSEYHLDLRSFSWPRAWDDLWAASTGGFRVNGASLDCCSLYLDQGLVFARRLSPRLEFRFRYEHLDDKDRRELHHWLELETAVGRGWSVELFGEPTYDKEDADIGLGVRWRGGGRQVRLRRIAVDWNTNSRGRAGVRDSLKPYTNQLLAETPLAGGVARAFAELDEPMRREDSVARRSFGYRRDLYRLSWEREGPWAPRLSWTYDRQERLDRFATAALGTSTDFRRRAHQWTVSARRFPDARDELEPGLSVLWRSARADDPYSPAAGVSYRRWEAQPWLRWRRRHSDLITTEVGPFLSLGQQGFAASTGRKNPTLAEAKLDGAVEFHWGERGRIGLHSSFDVDTPGKPWDGGNVRAMLLF